MFAKRTKSKAGRSRRAEVEQDEATPIRELLASSPAPIHDDDEVLRRPRQPSAVANASKKSGVLAFSTRQAPSADPLVEAQPRETTVDTDTSDYWGALIRTAAVQDSGGLPASGVMEDGPVVVELRTDYTEAGGEDVSAAELKARKLGEMARSLKDRLRSGCDEEGDDIMDFESPTERIRASLEVGVAFDAWEHQQIIKGAGGRRKEIGDESLEATAPHLLEDMAGEMVKARERLQMLRDQKKLILEAEAEAAESWVDVGDKAQDLRTSVKNGTATLQLIQSLADVMRQKHPMLDEAWEVLEGLESEFFHRSDAESSGAAAEGAAPAVDEFGRDVKQKSERRRQRRQTKLAESQAQHIDGWETSDEEEERKEFTKLRAEFSVAAEQIFADVVPEISDFGCVRRAIEGQARLAGACCREDFTSIASFFARKQMLRWDPLRLSETNPMLTQTSETESFEWVQTLAELPNTEEAEKIMETVAADLVLRRMMHLLTACWNPLSDSSTKACASLINEMNDLLCENEQPLQKLLEAVLVKVKTTMATLAASRERQTANEMAIVILRCLKLTRCLSAFRGLLTDDVLIPLANELRPTIVELQSKGTPCADPSACGASCSRCFISRGAAAAAGAWDETEGPAAVDWVREVACKI